MRKSLTLAVTAVGTGGTTGVAGRAVTTSAGLLVALSSEL